MLKSLLLAGLAAAALTPSLASAQASCQTESNHNRTLGTIIGAGFGALLGNAIGEHGGKVGGTIIGGVGGGVAGNMIAGSASHCQTNRYGYYDSNGRWVPNTQTTYGYYDSDGHWVENGAGGGPANYAPNAAPRPPLSDNDRRDVRRPAPWMDGRENLAAREDRLEADIRQRADSGAMSHEDARDAMRRLRDIRRDDANARDDDNRLAPEQRADLERRLDDLAGRLGEDRRADDDRDRPAPGY